MLGSQLAPEDLIGVPQVVDGVSRFCPPAQIARTEPYCLFLDELNACSHEVPRRSMWRAGNSLPFRPQGPVFWVS